ncbi:filamentous hemagglutinin family protein [Variovorax boronicumulans]|uniref:ESPR-type extended signal peptide-containing protein n=1 Tax=Variovorax boronicumulans TaxID=436515 RepID=UPI00278812ED|nr:ESPR-type extended signal peptide-containing protein [Variovorax boronicumulans]MDQ0086049.1 filamentous hemagglutinin family protein [Variovorax boronicumulans]
MHQIVFNAARGIRIVVLEIARSTGKGSNKATKVVASALAGAAALVPMLIGAALADMLPTTSAHARIVGALKVPGNLRPTLQVAHDRVPYLRSMASDPASFIFRKVNGRNPSQLRENSEVAGRHAEIIIDCSAGINVDGVVSLNASKVSQSTGVPQFNAVG